MSDIKNKITEKYFPKIEKYFSEKKKKKWDPLSKCKKWLIGILFFVIFGIVLVFYYMPDIISFYEERKAIINRLRGEESTATEAIIPEKDSLDNTDTIDSIKVEPIDTIIPPLPPKEKEKKTQFQVELLVPYKYVKQYRAESILMDKKPIYHNGSPKYYPNMRDDDYVRFYINATEGNHTFSINGLYETNVLINKNNQEVEIICN